MNRSLKFLLFFLAPLFAGAQQPSFECEPEVSIEDSSSANITACFFAPLGSSVTWWFEYSQGGDTLSTSPVPYVESDGLVNILSISNIFVSCNSLTEGHFNAVVGQDTIQSSSVTWTVPCGGPVFVSFSATEVVGVGVVIAINYNSGSVVGTLSFQTSVNGVLPMVPHTVSVFGTGTYTFTLPVAAQQTYEVCYPQINNGFDVMFLNQCIGGTMDGSPPIVNLIASVEDNQAELSVHVITSGNVLSNFFITMEKMLCDGSYESFFTSDLYLNELIVDSVFTLPTPPNLPSAPGWRFTISGTNGYELTPQVVDVNVAVGVIPTVTLSLNDLGGGFYTASSTWNDFGAGNVLLSYYVNDVLVGTLNPTSSPVNFNLPTQIEAYSGGVVEVVLTSNACANAVAIQNIQSCTSPIISTGSATAITLTSANVQLFVNLQGCVDQAMAGIILMTGLSIVDTLWSPVQAQGVNWTQTMYLTGLMSGTTYYYRGIVYAEGVYFMSSPSFSFTTPAPVEPFFENAGVLWDGMNIAVILGYDFGDFDPSIIKLRIRHNPPIGPEVIVFNQFAPDESHNQDINVSGQYGTHSVRAELYNSVTNEVYEMVGPFTHTYQQTTGIVELEKPGVVDLGRPIERFDSVSVYDLSGRQVAVFSQGDMLSPELPVGIYIFVGRKEGEVVSSKIYLQ